MKKGFIFIMVILLLTGCSNILKWDSLTEKNWQDIRLVENLGPISPSTPPKIRVNDEGTIYVIYTEITMAINKLHLLSKKEGNENWEIQPVSESIYNESDLVFDKDGVPNIFYQTYESSGKIIFHWWKEGRIIKHFDTNSTSEPFKIKCLMDNNDNMIVFYTYSISGTGYLEKLDFGRDLTSDIIIEPTNYCINDYDVIIDKETNKFYIVYNDSNNQYSIFYKNSDMANPHIIRSLSDTNFNNFCIDFDNDNIVIGYSFNTATLDKKTMLEKLMFSKDKSNDPPFFKEGEIITEFTGNYSIMASSLFNRNGINYGFSILDGGYDKVYYTKMNKSYYEKELQLSGIINDYPPNPNFFVDKKGYSYILYLNGDSSKKELRLLTNRPL